MAMKVGKPKVEDLIEQSTELATTVDDHLDDEDGVDAAPAAQVSPTEPAVEHLQRVAETLQEEAAAEVEAPQPSEAASLSDVVDAFRDVGSNVDETVAPAPEMTDTPAPDPVAVPTQNTTTPSEAAPVTQNGAQGAPDTGADEKQETPAHGTPTNGTALSPEALAAAAAAEKAKSQGGYGGGGGGLLSGVAGMVGNGLGKGARLAGKGVMKAGGQQFADRFLTPRDPISIAKRAGRIRYRDLCKGIDALKAAGAERDNNVNAFNKAIEASLPGKQLAAMAAQRKVNLGDFLTQIENGAHTSPEVTSLYQQLQGEPHLHQLAKNIGESQKSIQKAAELGASNLNMLARDHKNMVNVEFEQNRLLDAVTKAGEATPHAVATKAGGTPESNSDESPDTANSKESRKKFNEMIDKMKEAIAAILKKVMSMFGAK